MLTFLFWNIGPSATVSDERRSLLLRLIASAARERAADFVILAEPHLNPAEVSSALNGASQAYSFRPTECERIHVFTRLAPEFVAPVLESGHVTVRRVRLPNRPEFLLACVHLVSRNRTDTVDRLQHAAALRRDLEHVEDVLVGHSRTVLTGDLNMDPFDPGVASHEGLNAVMTRRLARNGVRSISVLGRPVTRRVFYNPMWNHLGDDPPGPPGTYYFDDRQPGTLYWHASDQVLIRPALLDAWAGVEVLDAVGDTSLLTDEERYRGVPRRNAIADHLP